MPGNVNAFCPDRCPICWFDLKKDGYPLGHQQPESGATRGVRWDLEGALQAELDEQFAAEQ